MSDEISFSTLLRLLAEAWSQRLGGLPLVTCRRGVRLLAGGAA